jgi:hypothetical protein
MTDRWERRAKRRDKKRRKRRYGHRRDGDSVKLIQLLKRNRYWQAMTMEDDNETTRAS